MDRVTQKKKAKEFVKRWKAAEGNEQREANSFWTELCQEVLGISNPTHVLNFERKVKGKRIDVFYEDHRILIENKSRGIDLDKPEQRGKNNDGSPRMVTPYEQARWYADNITPRSVAPKYILTCNFDEIRIYDTDEEYPEKTYETIKLDEIPNLYHRLSFFTRKENSRQEREKNLSIEAGTVVGRLYDALAKSYLDIENSEEEQKSLNMLITRIVFLLYAEDSGHLHERNAFYNYLSNYQTSHMRDALRDLFLVLKTEEDKRDPYLPKEVLAFPYINGGLFKDDIIIPQFTDEARYILLKEASAEFDWHDISPTIFGAVFESTLTAKRRREGGMHYTSVENIHKVTGPLFYDDLLNELTTIEGIKTNKEREFKLRKFREKLASIHVLDPACGSGNFLTETYRSFRKLENRVLEDLKYDQVEGQVGMGQMNPIMVTLDQFYGIEIDDFAVEVAKTALWIAELQMLEETREILDLWLDPLPLKSNDNIVCGNALRMDWGDVLPAEKCDYIIGNPPFIGQAMQTKEQSHEVSVLFPDVKNAGKLDYVAGWFKKATTYSKNTNITCSFVASNSICQGESVGALWKGLFDEGCIIDFAYTTFVWDSEAADKAHVHVIICGFSMKKHSSVKKLFSADGSIHIAGNINGYLKDAPNVFLKNRTKTISENRCIVTQGSQPMEDGQLLFTADEKNAFVARYPEMETLFRPLLGSREFLNDTTYSRYCLWLEDVDSECFMSNAEITERLNHVKLYRENNKIPRIRQTSNVPHLFTQIRQPKETYLIIPRVSSERRKYIPIGYVEPDVIASDAVVIVDGATLYDFGLLSSLTHNSWVRTIAGRLKSDYRYAPSVYYNFPYPSPTQEAKTAIESCAQAVLNVRDNHPGTSLAFLYNPDTMPDDLLAAHKALDAAVEAAYGVDFGGDEEKIVAHLFKLYDEATRKEKGEVTEPKKDNPNAATVKVKVKRVNKQ